MRHVWLLAAVTVVLAVALLLALGSDDAGDPRPRPAPRIPLPTAAALARAVAPDALEGHLVALQRIAERDGGARSAGTRGYRDSAAYVAGRLRAAGWRVRESPTSFPYFAERSPPRVRAAGDAIRAATLRFSGSGSASGRATPVGLGCAAADYRALGRGDVAVARRGGCLLRTIALAAERAGASAVLIYDPSRGGAPLPGTLIRPGIRIPALAVLRRSGRALEGGRPAVSVRVDAFSGRRRDRTVLAELGSGSPAVMAGAHLDSVPEGPGVNDNASGVATLLEIARQAGRARERPRRTLRLAFWAAEELGLYGSRRYVDGLSRAERRRIAAYLNLDMVGSANGGRFVYGGGRGTARRGARAVRALFRRRGVKLERIGLLGGGSDHAPFNRAGIPVLGLFSGAGGAKTKAQQRAWGGRAGRAFDSCYHLRCDRVGRIDRATLSELSDGAAVALYAMAWR